MTESTLFEFPCDFPLKVMGQHSDEFQDQVLSIVERHVGSLDPARIQHRSSKDRRYVSVTFTLRAESKEQLDNLYRDLTSCKSVLYVL